ncbi:1-deoxyxylulose-5-phosphate synthase YajO-like [Ruditapes philippinarum]|uniref:1-deoxyxylulose-5-phosphate synthase YajO-like n=1 Tax=Ruditapes philippinarum TaxID=129788 RepID=UPI00295A70C7|nr:1-deoxyxylulose-5-phosphate synthase YajO-like [Ruditapes philippinarum]
MAKEIAVEYNYLGKTGVRVSNLCLGTMTFGDGVMPVPTQLNEEMSHKLMDRYSELGGNFLDTADMYGIGASERVVGSWLKKSNRSKFILATKVRYQTDFKNVNKVGLSRRHIVESCEGSLERLQTDYIDLYQSHAWDNGTPIEETLRTFDDLVRCGKIRYFGVCNVCGWQLQKIADKIEMMGLNSCATLQQQYNLLARQSEFEEFMVCANEGIGVLPWSPLKGGLLTGKFERNKTPDAKGSRIGFVHQDESKAMQAAPAWSQYNDDDNYWKLMDAMKEIAKIHGKTVPQVSLRWLLQKDVVCSVIIGATSLKQLEDNMGASTGWELTDEEMSRLDKASPRVNMYPYDTIWRPGAVRINPFNSSNTI